MKVRFVMHDRLGKGRKNHSNIINKYSPPEKLLRWSIHGINPPETELNTELMHI